MLEIPKIIETEPDLVVIEITPNTFANISNLDYLEPIIELRIGLASTIQNENEQKNWRENILEEHEKYLVDNSIEKTLFWNKYRQDILNEGIRNSLSSDAKEIDMKNPARNYRVKNDSELLQLMDSFYDEKGSFFGTYPKGDIYSWYKGNTFPNDLDPYKIRPDHKICLFNNSASKIYSDEKMYDIKELDDKW